MLGVHEEKSVRNYKFTSTILRCNVKDPREIIVIKMTGFCLREQFPACVTKILVPFRII